MLLVICGMNITPALGESLPVIKEKTQEGKKYYYVYHKN